MSVEEVYQVVLFESVSLADPELMTVVSDWTDGDVSLLDNIPEDAMNNMKESNFVLLLNKSNGSVGAVSPETFALNFQTARPSKDFNVLRQSVVSQVVEKLEIISNEKHSDEFYAGVNSAIEVIRSIQSNLVEDSENEV